MQLVFIISSKLTFKPTAIIAPSVACPCKTPFFIDASLQIHPV